jgi:TolA-binding protein
MRDDDQDRELGRVAAEVERASQAAQRYRRLDFWRPYPKQEEFIATGIRELASRSEVHSLPEIRKTAGYFQQKTTALRALSRSVEEARMELMTQIDLLQELKVQLEFNRAGGQIGELLKRGEASINSIQVIATDAQQLANDLAAFGRTAAAAGQSPANSAPPATTTPATAAKTPPNPSQAIKMPAAEARPADSANPAQAIKRR